MRLYKIFQEIMREVDKVWKEIRKEEIKKLIEKIISSPRIFIAGEGRTGLVGKMFGIRLLHLGKEVFFVGDPLTPSFEEEDLLLIFSGRGEKERFLPLINRAKRLGGEVILVTGNPSTPLLQFCSSYILLPQSVKSLNPSVSSQPLNSLFEQSLFFLLESMIFLLYQNLHISEEEMLRRHANL